MIISMSTETHNCVSARQSWRLTGARPDAHEADQQAQPSAASTSPRTDCATPRAGGRIGLPLPARPALCARIQSKASIAGSIPLPCSRASFFIDSPSLLGQGFNDLRGCNPRKNQSGKTGLCLLYSMGFVPPRHYRSPFVSSVKFSTVLLGFLDVCRALTCREIRHFALELGIQLKEFISPLRRKINGEAA